MASSVAMALPAFAPAEWRDVGYQAVLSGLLEDWVENGTTAPDLDQQDETDLADILKLCADVALAQDQTLRDVTFQTLIKNGVRDWVANWNADEDEE